MKRCFALTLNSLGNYLLTALWTELGHRAPSPGLQHSCSRLSSPLRPASGCSPPGSPPAGPGAAGPGAAAPRPVGSRTGHRRSGQPGHRAPSCTGDKWQGRGARRHLVCQGVTSGWTLARVGSMPGGRMKPGDGYGSIKAASLILPRVLVWLWTYQAIQEHLPKEVGYFFWCRFSPEMCRGSCETQILLTQGLRGEPEC